MIRPIARGAFRHCEQAGIGWCRARANDEGLDLRERVRRFAVGLIGEALLEHMLAFYAVRGRLVRVDLLAVGDTDAVPFQLAAISKGAREAGADQVVLAHNHPAGDARPSVPDLTDHARAKRLLRELAGLDLLDELVVSGTASTWISEYDGEMLAGTAARPEADKLQRLVPRLAAMPRPLALDRLAKAGVPEDLRELALPDWQPEGHAVLAGPVLRPKIDRVLGWSPSSVGY